MKRILEGQDDTIILWRGWLKKPCLYFYELKIIKVKKLIATIEISIACYYTNVITEKNRKTLAIRRIYLKKDKSTLFRIEIIGEAVRLHLLSIASAAKSKPELSIVLSDPLSFDFYYQRFLDKIINEALQK